MARYIDADVLKAEIDQALENNFNVKIDRIKSLANRGITYNDEFVNIVDGKISALQGINDFIDNQIADDVMEIVRCNDCKNYDGGSCGLDYDGNPVWKPDDYCSYGERRELDASDD